MTATQHVVTKLMRRKGPAAFCALAMMGQGIQPYPITAAVPLGSCSMSL
jgi:hypothetical protein